MPLHPQAAALLEQMGADMPPIHTLGVEGARQMTEAMGQTTEPEPVARVEDRSATGPHGPVPVRVYRPEGSLPLPVLVYFHGGGWVIGSIDSHDAVCRLLANRAGCVVVSVGYRLAPEHRFPAAVDDAYAATAWVADHAAELGGDPARLAVGGDSAGGNLAAVVSLMARDRGGPPLAFQVLVYPVTEHEFARPSFVENAEGYLLTTEDMRWFWGQYLVDDADGANPYASPMRADDLSGLPPALVVTAEFDPLRDQGAAYAERLQECGVPVTYASFDGMFHGFVSMAGLLDSGRDAIEQTAEVLRAAFGSGRP